MRAPTYISCCWKFALNLVSEETNSLCKPAAPSSCPSFSFKIENERRDIDDPLW